MLGLEAEMTEYWVGKSVQVRGLMLGAQRAVLISILACVETRNSQNYIL